MEAHGSKIHKFQLAARRLSRAEHMTEKNAACPNKRTKTWHLEQVYCQHRLKCARERMATYPQEWTTLYLAKVPSETSVGDDMPPGPPEALGSAGNRSR